MPTKQHVVSSKNTVILGQFSLFGVGDILNKRGSVHKTVARSRDLCYSGNSTVRFVFPPPTISHKRNYFRSEFIEDKMLVFILSVTFSKECLILGWIRTNIIINVRRFSSEVSVILVRFESNLIFPHRFSYHPHILTSVDVRPMGAEFFHPDGYTWPN